MTLSQDSPSAVAIAEAEAFYDTYGRDPQLPARLEAGEEEYDEQYVGVMVTVLLPYLNPEQPGSPYSDEDRIKAIRAHEFSDLIDDLVEGENREDALVVARVAVRLYRELTEVDPPTNRPLLARAMRVLSVRLGDCDRPEAALRAAEDACVIYRALTESGSGSNLSGLAGALRNLSVRYSELGRPAEALAPAEEAVRILRPLAASKPERYGSNLAVTLDNLVRRLGHLGRLEEALATAEDAAKYCRRLVEADREAHRADLAFALLTLARMHAGGRLNPGRALPLAVEAAGLFADLAQDDEGYDCARESAVVLVEDLTMPTA